MYPAPGFLARSILATRIEKGFRDTFRFKLIYGTLATVAGILIFWFFGGYLISLFLHEGSNAGNLEKTLACGKQYLRIMLIGLIPFAISQAYASSLREMGKTVLPMAGGIVAIFVNLSLNYVLIFGKFGAPALGVAGAAIATVSSRFAETLIVVLTVGRHVSDYPFAQGAWRTMRVPANLQKKIWLKGSPL